MAPYCDEITSNRRSKLLCFAPVYASQLNHIIVPYRGVHLDLPVAVSQDLVNIWSYAPNSWPAASFRHLRARFERCHDFSVFQKMQTQEFSRRTLVCA